MKMKLFFLSMLGLFLHVVAMELPREQRGAKRPAAALEESESDVELAASAPEKYERKDIQAQERKDLEAKLQQLKTTELPDLPLELQTRLLTFILDAHGPTQLARLYNAAENIRNYMQADKAYYEWLNNLYMTNFIINELARKYTKDNDVILAAQALATDQASKWLGHVINGSLGTDDQNQVVVVDPKAGVWATHFASYIKAALEHNMPDVYRMLTNYVEPAKRGWFLNRIFIMSKPVASYLIINKSHELLNELLNTPGVNLNIADEDGTTPLHHAVKEQNVLLVHRLLKYPGIQVDAVTKAGETPLVFASSNGNLPIVNELLSKGAAVNLLDVGGSSALMQAIANAKREIVARLLQVPGININLQVNDRSDAALHYAIYTHDLEILRMLLNAHTDQPIQVNIRGQDGATPLHRALRFTNYREMIEMLLAAGANRNSTDDAGKTPLIWATTLEDDAGPLKILLGRGADVNARDNEGHTALWYAQESDQPEKVRLLREAGATE